MTSTTRRPAWMCDRQWHRGQVLAAGGDRYLYVELADGHRRPVRVHGAPPVRKSTGEGEFLRQRIAATLGGGRVELSWCGCAPWCAWVSAGGRNLGEEVRRWVEIFRLSQLAQVPMGGPAARRERLLAGRMLTTL